MVPRLIFESVAPGATIQDGGRFGLLRFGVTPAGPMDWVAFETANLALGNAADAAAIEIGPGGLTVGTDAPVLLAFAGGGFAWTQGDRALPPAARILLRPGDRLKARSGRWGAFAYCAVPGGVDVPKVMGSRATHMRSGLGGCEGHGIRAGDGVCPTMESPDLDDAAITASWIARSETPIRIVLGPQDDYFVPEAIATLQNAPFSLTAAADRMAYKFQGPKLVHAKDFNIVSDGIALGAIQVAGDGQPIVLMADRQPTGCYAKIAHVCHADIGRLAQMRSGMQCRFEVIDVEIARGALLALKARIAATAKEVAPLRLLPTTTHLLTTNLVGGVTDGEI